MFTRPSTGPFVYLEQEQDVSPAPRRNYLSNVRQFMAWCESRWQTETATPTVTTVEFNPQAVATPLLVHYRQWLQQEQHLKPNNINRYLVSLKRYFGWAVTTGVIERDPGQYKLLSDKLFLLEEAEGEKGQG